MQFHQQIQLKGFVPGCIYPLPSVGVSRMPYLSRALQRLEVTAEHRIHVPPEFRLGVKEKLISFGRNIPTPFPNPVYTEAVGFVSALSLH